jgi:hypothetical protein
MQHDPHSTCRRKVRFPKKSEAETVRFQMRLTHGMEATAHLHSYRCEACGGWHLGRNGTPRPMLPPLIALVSRRRCG